MKTYTELLAGIERRAVAGSLDEALSAIATQFELDSAALALYANEDTLGGYHPDPDYQRFPMGCIWGVEGQILYALARILSAHTIVEIGGWSGCSTTHFAAAVLVNGGGGQVISVDNGSELSHVSGAHGSAIPTPYLDVVELVNADGLAWLAAYEDASIDILFDDAAHTPEVVSGIATLAQRKLRGGGLLITHDAMHPRIGAQVRNGLALGGVESIPFLIEPADCGLAIWRAPLAPQEGPALDRLHPWERKRLLEGEWIEGGQAKPKPTRARRSRSAKKAKKGTITE